MQSQYWTKYQSKLFYTKDDGEDSSGNAHFIYLFLRNGKTFVLALQGQTSSPVWQKQTFEKEKTPNLRLLTTESVFIVSDLNQIKYSPIRPYKSTDNLLEFYLKLADNFLKNSF